MTGLVSLHRSPHPCYQTLSAYGSDLLTLVHMNFPQRAWSVRFVLLAYSTPWLAGHAPAISESVGSLEEWFLPCWLLLCFSELITNSKTALLYYHESLPRAVPMLITSRTLKTRTIACRISSSLPSFWCTGMDHRMLLHLLPCLWFQRAGHMHCC